MERVLQTIGFPVPARRTELSISYFLFAYLWEYSEIHVGHLRVSPLYRR